VTSTEAERREAIDAAQAAGFKVKTGPKVKDPEKIELVPEPTAGADPVMSAPPGRPDPAPTRGGNEFTIWKGVSARVFPPDGETYPVEFLKNGRRLCIETPKSPIWVSTNLQDKAAAAIEAALIDDEDRPPRDTIRKKLREKFAEFAELIKSDPEVQQTLTSEPVRMVLEKTKKVIVHPSKDIQKTFYEVILGDRELRATPAQMGGRDPRFLNSAWTAMFYEPLDATPKDWLQIRARWMDRDVMKIDETEESTEAEDVIDRLRLELETVSLVDSPDQVISENHAWKDPITKEVWVPARMISNFLENTAKKPGWSSRLSKEIRAAGGMKTATRTKKMGKPPRDMRCWVFDGGFANFRDIRDGPGEVSDYARIEGGETGDL
jgi:hypothetical protein